MSIETTTNKKKHIQDTLCKIKEEDLVRSTFVSEKDNLNYDCDLKSSVAKYH